jgi:imidazolonepropionase-like amidohydrolase
MRQSFSKDGKIQSISQSTRTQPVPDAILVDARGKFLIAGLWDMHVHALGRNEPDRFFPMFIANGVTGIRDLGGGIPLPQIAQLKKEIAGGSRLGPEVFAAGPSSKGNIRFGPFLSP